MGNTEKVVNRQNVEGANDKNVMIQIQMPL